MFCDWNRSTNSFDGVAVSNGVSSEYRNRVEKVFKMVSSNHLRVTYLKIQIHYMWTKYIKYLVIWGWKKKKQKIIESIFLVN